MYKYFLAGLIIIIIMIAFIGCCGTKNTISGTIFVSGNEPFTYLILKGEDDSLYRLNCDESIQKDLWSLQGQDVKLYYTDLKDLDHESIITVKKFKKLNQ